MLAPLQNSFNKPWYLSIKFEHDNNHSLRSGINMSTLDVQLYIDIATLSRTYKVLKKILGFDP